MINRYVVDVMDRAAGFQQPFWNCAEACEWSCGRVTARRCDYSIYDNRPIANVLAERGVVIPWVTMECDNLAALRRMFPEPVFVIRGPLADQECEFPLHTTAEDLSVVEALRKRYPAMDDHQLLAITWSALRFAL